MENNINDSQVKFFNTKINVSIITMLSLKHAEINCIEDFKIQGLKDKNDLLKVRNIKSCDVIKIVRYLKRKGIF